MARLIVGAAEYGLPDDADIEDIIATIRDAMSARTSVVLTVIGDDDRMLRLILNCANLDTVVVDPSAGGRGGGGWGDGGRGGGRISG